MSTRENDNADWVEQTPEQKKLSDALEHVLKHDFAHMPANEIAAVLAVSLANVAKAGNLPVRLVIDCTIQQIAATYGMRLQRAVGTEPPPKPTH